MEPFYITPKYDGFLPDPIVYSKRVDADDAEGKVKAIEELLAKVKELGLSQSVADALVAEQDSYELGEMTKEERERLRYALNRSGLGSSGAYVSNGGMLFTAGAKVTEVADPVETFQKVFDALKGVHLFNGGFALVYPETNEYELIAVGESKVWSEGRKPLPA